MSRAAFRQPDWFKGVEKSVRRRRPPTSAEYAENIGISSMLSKLPMIGREQAEDVMRVVPGETAPVLQAAGIPFILAGAHGIAGWLPEPRATQDVDFIIRLADRRKAADALLCKFPDWNLEENPDVWRFQREGQYVLDLILTRAPLFKRVFKEFTTTRIGGAVVRVPKLEAALAMKYASMIGHYRKYEKKFIDAGDFASMIRHAASLDLKLLAEIGELVYPGEGLEIVKYVDDVRAGRKLEI